MNIYRISQKANDDYDTYDAAIIAANTEDEARDTHPGGGPADWPEIAHQHYGSWCYAREQVKVELLGMAAPETPSGVLLASFNAG